MENGHRTTVDALAPPTEGSAFLLPRVIVRGTNKVQTASLTDEKGQSLDTGFILRSLISMQTCSRRRLLVFLDQNNFGNGRTSGNGRMFVISSCLTVNRIDLLTQKHLQLFR